MTNGKADRSALREFLAHEFPQSDCTIEHVGERSATVRHAIGPDDLRPGGTVSGPVLMKVADVALYIALLGEIGIVPLAVTTNLTINFLRKPRADAAVVGICRLIKVGRSIAVGEVELYSEGSEELVAKAVGSYAIPSPGGGGTGGSPVGGHAAKPAGFAADTPTVDGGLE